jgi:hypothetical protein
MTVIQLTKANFPRKDWSFDKKFKSRPICISNYYQLKTFREIVCLKK